MKSTFEPTATKLREIGAVQLTQIAPSSLKTGVYPDERYDPALLLPVASLVLTTRGVVGVTADGNLLMDIHNADHPQARRWHDNGISVGFTSHYAALRVTFGPQSVDGCGGENIVIACDERWTLDDLDAGLLIRRSSTGELIRLARPLVATPCAPFARFATGNAVLAGAAMKAALMALHHGQRGFYIGLDAPLPVAVVQAGDRVYVPVARSAIATSA